MMIVVVVVRSLCGENHPQICVCGPFTAVAFCPHVGHSRLLTAGFQSGARGNSTRVHLRASRSHKKGQRGVSCERVASKPECAQSAPESAQNQKHEVEGGLAQLSGTETEECFKWASWSCVSDFKSAGDVSFLRKARKRSLAREKAETLA